MAKKRKSKTGKFLKGVFNVRYWSDWDRTKRGSVWLVDTLKKFFVIQEPTEVETFPQAMQRLKISNEDIEKRKRFLFGLAIFMATVAILLFGYAVYHLYYLNIAAFIISLVVMGIALVLAFRYHFWYYQLKVKKLGCSVREWFTNGLMGGG